MITIPTIDGLLTLYTQNIAGHQAGDFVFDLTSSTGHPLGQGNNEIQQQFSYTLADSDGDSSSANLVIHIVDDVPSFVNIYDPDHNGVVDISAVNPASNTTSSMQLADWIFGADGAGATPTLQSTLGNVVLESSTNNQVKLDFYDGNNNLVAVLTLNSDGTDNLQLMHRESTIVQDELLTGEAQAGGPGIYFVDSNAAPDLTIRITGDNGDGIPQPTSNDQVNPSAQGWAVDNNIVSVNESLKFDFLDKSSLTTHIGLSNFAFAATGFTGGQSSYDLQIKVTYDGGATGIFNITVTEGQLISVNSLAGFNAGSLIDSVEVKNVDTSAGSNNGFRLNDVTVYHQSSEPPPDLNYNFKLSIVDADGDPASQSFSLHLDGGSPTAPLPPAPSVLQNDSGIVYESGLPAGSDHSKPVTASGNVFTNDTLPSGGSIASVTYNGTDYFSVNGVITIQTLIGTLLLYSANSNSHLAGDFEYTLNHAAQHPDGLGNNTLGESFTYHVLDGGGHTLSADLNVQVVDDVPKAVDDPTVDSTNGSTATGNVLSNDVTGADVPAHVVSFTYDGGVHSATIPDGSFTTVATAQGGLLTVWSDGTWKYVPPDLTHQGGSNPPGGAHSGNVDNHNGNTDHSTHGQNVQDGQKGNDPNIVANAGDQHSGSASAHSGNVDHNLVNHDHSDGGQTGGTPQPTSFHDDFTYTMSDADGDKSSATQFILVTNQDNQNNPGGDHHSGSQDHKSGGQDSSNKDNGCVTEVSFHTDDAKQYIQDHHLSDQDAIVGSDGKTVHFLLPKDGSDIEFTTPSGASLCINNKGEYTYTAAYDKVKDGGESFDCVFKDDQNHYFQGKLDINANNHPDSLIDLLGSKPDVHDNNNAHSTITFQGDANNADYIVDASELKKSESIPMKDLDMNLGNVLNYLKIAHDTAGNDASSHDALTNLSAGDHTVHTQNVDPAHYVAPSHTDEQAIQQHIDQVSGESGTHK